MTSKPAVNLRKVLSESILNPLRGGRGLEVALGEMSNNSFDAQATEIRIKIGYFKEELALFIMDNGNGFTSRGISSVLGYAYSERDSKDLSKMGLWGTGSKSVLGLGSLDYTKVSVFSFSNEYPTGVGLNFDFDYLVNLADKKVDGTKNIIQKINSEDFAHDWQRKTGSTIILTGFDKKKVTPEKIMKALSDRLSPRMAVMVQVFIDEEYRTVVPSFIDGKPFNFSINFPVLGEINLEIYYACTTGELSICGPFNNICEYSAVHSSLSAAHKKRVTGLWRSISGFIYIEKIKFFRTHDNSLSQAFYDGPAVEEFVEMLEVVTEELKKLEDDEKREANTIKKWEMLNKISNASQALKKIPTDLKKKNFNGGPIIAKPGHVDQPIFLVPRNIEMGCQQEAEITLHNKGTNLGVGFNDARWNAVPQLVSVSGKGRTVNIKSSKNEGVCSLEISGGFGKHVILVRVGKKYESKTPFIDGPKHVNRGDVVSYEIRRYSNTVNPDWFVTDQNVEITKKGDRNVTIKIPDDFESTEFMLQCFGENNKIISQKRIMVTDSKGHKGNLMITFGETHYIIDFSMTYPNCIAQIESDEDIPVIVINPNFGNSKKINEEDTIKSWINGIAAAAMAHQVGTQIISDSKGINLFHQFKDTMEKKIFN